MVWLWGEQIWCHRHIARLSSESSTKILPQTENERGLPLCGSGELKDRHVCQKQIYHGAGRPQEHRGVQFGQLWTVIDLSDQ